MSEIPKIGKREMAALAECHDYIVKGSNYYWRRASMEKLIAHGLVEFVPWRGMEKSYVPTEAGRAALARARGEAAS